MDICYHCKRPITGTTLTTMGRSYHQSCFVCSQCHQPIQGKFTVGDNQQPICGNCKEGIHGSMACARCNQPIKDSVITALGQKFHPQCFVCSICNRKINSEFNHLHNKPVCFDCFAKSPGAGRSSGHFSSDNTCAVCKEKLSHGTIVTALDKKYHKACFICEECKNPITGEFNGSSGKVYCSQCYNIHFAKRCHNCNLPISDSEFTVFDGQNFHHSCFRCTICGKGLAGQVLSRSKVGGVCCVTHDQ